MAGRRRSRSRSRNSIPDGWYLADHVNQDNGTTVQCYTNPLGQKFFSMEDLLRYVEYAEEAKVSIYSPQPRSARPRKQVEKAAGKQRSRSLLQNQDPTSVTDAQPHRASRRLAGQQPEHLPTLSNNQDWEATQEPKSTLAPRRLFGPKPEHLSSLSNGNAMEATKELEPRRSSRRLAGLAHEHVPASF